MRRALPTLLAAAAVALGLALPGSASANAIDRDGMWIWYVSRSSGGLADRIVAKAARHNVGTVVIKAADGRDPWRQFSPYLVSQLRAAGLKVCAYQFVYGRYPRTEALRGAEAARAGADCLMIDAEGHYEGRYAAAQTYIKRLRALVGPDLEVGLTSFPYVYYHPSFPYSVFLGPGGAQENVPQMYWKTIGVSTDRIYQVTYTYNSVYRRPIYPLGQTYGHPTSPQILRFRKLARTYGAKGVSWWVWQYSGGQQWGAVGSAFEPIALLRRDTLPVLKRKYRSDIVVWAQQHLLKLGLLKEVNGNFGGATQNAVMSFQYTHGLPVTGQIDGPTWRALLPTGPATVRWSARNRRAVAASGGRTMPEPLNAREPAVRNELRGKPGG
jgi:putative peptidoglycan binding protein